MSKQTMSTNVRHTPQARRPRPKRAPSYRDDETVQLIGIWSRVLARSKFKGESFLRESDWHIITRQLNQIEDVIPSNVPGVAAKKMPRYARHWDENKTKIQNLRSLYSSEKSKMLQGGYKSKWKFFNMMHAVLDSDDPEEQRTVLGVALNDVELLETDNTTDEFDIQVEELHLEYSNDMPCGSPDGASSGSFEQIAGTLEPGMREITPEPEPPAEPRVSRKTPESRAVSSASTRAQRQGRTRSRSRGPRPPSRSSASASRSTTTVPSTHSQLLEQLIAHDQTVVDLLQRRVRLEERAAEHDAQLAKLQEEAHIRDQKLAASQEMAMTTMASYFSSRAAAGAQGNSCKSCCCCHHGQSSGSSSKGCGKEQSAQDPKETEKL